jgi:hypothetical protein
MTNFWVKNSRVAGVGWPLLRAEGFFCYLDILYGGLGIGKLQFLKEKKI